MSKSIAWNALKAACAERNIAVPAKWADKKETIEAALAQLMAPVSRADVEAALRRQQVMREEAQAAAQAAAIEAEIVARRAGKLDLRTREVDTTTPFLGAGPRSTDAVCDMPAAEFNDLINGLLARYHGTNPKFAADNNETRGFCLYRAEELYDKREEFIARNKAAEEAAREQALAEQAAASKLPALVREQAALVDKLIDGDTTRQVAYDAGRKALLGYGTNQYPAPATKSLLMANKRHQTLAPAAENAGPGSLIVRHEGDFNAFYAFDNVPAFLRDAARLIARDHSFHEVLRARHRDEAAAINELACANTHTREYQAAQVDLEDLRAELAEQDDYEEIDENYVEHLSEQITLAEDRITMLSEDAAVAAHKKIAIEEADLRSLILDVDGAGIDHADEELTIAIFTAAYVAEFTERYLEHTEYARLFARGSVVANPRAPLVPGLDYIVINNSGLCHSKHPAPYKFSMGIRSGNYVTTPAESKLFAEGVRARLPANLQALLDMQVYTKDHGFRLPFQTKHNDRRYSRPLDCEGAPFEHLCMGANHKPLAVKLPLICPPNYDEFRAKIARVNHVDNATLRRAAEILAPYVPAGFTLFKTTGTMFEYRRMRNTPGLHCAICERAHDNENYFYGLIQQNGSVAYGCYIYTRWYKDINRRIDSGEHMPADLCERLHNKFVVVGAVAVDDAPAPAPADVAAAAAGPLPTIDQLQMQKRLKREFEMMEAVRAAPTYHRRIAPEAAEHYIVEHTQEVSPLPLCKTLLVQASMGAGKTQALIKLINDNFMRAIGELVAQKFSGKDQVIVALSHRETFATEIAARLQGFVSYKNIPENDIDTKKHPRVVVQMESAHRMSEKLVADLLIVDESESIFEQICSPLFRKGRQARIVLKALLDNSRHVICMDANMSHDTQHLVSGRGPFTLIRNTFIRNPLRARCTLSKEIWMDNLNADLGAGKKLVIPSNSLTAAKMIVESIALKFPALKVRLYSGETPNTEKAAEIAKVNEEWCKYDVVIYTPTITAGVSFTADHFDKIYCWFGEGSAGVDCCNQMTQRVRSVADKEMVVFVGRNYGHSMSRRDVIDCIKNDRNCLYSTHAGAAELAQMHAAKYTPSSAFYHEVAVRNIMRANRSDVRFHWEMVNCLKLAGHTIETIANTIQVDDALVTNTEIFTAMCGVKAEKFEAIAAAREINCEEAKKLTDSHAQLSMNDARALEKHTICQAYGITPEQVTANVCEEGTFAHREKYRRIQQAVAGLDAIRGMCEDKLKLATEGDEMFTQFSYRKQAHAQSLLKSLGYAGVLDESVLKAAVLRPAVEGLREKLMKEHRDIATMYGVRCKQLTTTSTFQSTLEYINAIFGAMYGIKLAARGRKTSTRDDYKLYLPQLCSIATTLRPQQ
jgi:hypothetical protein